MIFSNKTYWVYREKDDSLVGSLLLSGYEDDFLGVDIRVANAYLTNALNDEIVELFDGSYGLVNRGRVEEFTEYKTEKELKDAVVNHPKGPYYLNPFPIVKPEPGVDD